MKTLQKLILVLSVFLMASYAFAQTPSNRFWTTAGSAGTIDEADVGKVFFNLSAVQMGRLPANQPAAREAKNKRLIIAPPTQSAVIRYNVTPVDGIFVPPRACQPGANTGLELKLRYLATRGAQVVAKLIEVDSATGAETSRLTFDSNRAGLSQLDTYQVQSIVECGPGWGFDFKNKAYYIEATLRTRNSIANISAAGIQMIKIDTVTIF